MSDILHTIRGRSRNPLIQFIRYGIGGTLAGLTDALLFTLLAWKFFPALKDDEFIVRLFQIDIPDLSPAQRSLNFTVCKTIAFLFSNMVAYVINIYWVFESGRHSRRKEIGLFYLVSIVSFVVGTGLGAALVYHFRFTAANAYIANVVAAVSINFVCRKYLIFKN
jgi:putative flippase GtrA